MASQDEHQPTTAAQLQPQTDSLPSSTPVEMSHLQTPHDEPVSPMSPANETFATPPTSARHPTFAAAMQDTNAQTAQPPTTYQEQDSRHAPSPPAAGATSAPAAPTKDDIGPPTPPKEPQPPPQEKPTPIHPTTAIGPALSTTHLPALPAGTDPAEPVLQLMILLVSGVRHPFTISRAYLNQRGVHAARTKGKNAAMDEKIDPYGISGYTLKEMIWRDWREEWEARPTSPGGIRLISLGRLVDDSKPLSDYFSREREATSANHVVHMTVKPADIDDDDPMNKKKRGSSVEDGESAGCCRCCCVM